MRRTCEHLGIYTTSLAYNIIPLLHCFLILYMYSNAKAVLLNTTLISEKKVKTNGLNGISHGYNL